MGSVEAFNSIMATAGDSLTRLKMEGDGLVLYTGLLNMDVLKVPNGVVRVECSPELYNNRRNENHIERHTKQIILPDSVYYIGDSAFQDCEMSDTLQSNGLKIIGERAFLGCVIERVITPNLICIGKEAFRQNTGLKYIEASDCLNIDSYGLKECRNLKKIKAGINKVGTTAMYACTSLTEITFTAVNRNKIDKNEAFIKAHNMKIPNSIICEYGCQYLSDLKYVNMGNVAGMGEGFVHCEDIIKVVALGLKRVQLNKIGPLCNKFTRSYRLIDGTYAYGRESDAPIDIILRDVTSVDLACEKNVPYKLYFIKDAKVKFVSAINNKSVYISVKAKSCADRGTIERLVAAAKAI